MTAIPLGSDGLRMDCRRHARRVLPASRFLLTRATDVKDHHSPFDPARRDRSTYGIVFVFYAVLLYPILRADRIYEDDLGRVLIGRTGWDSNGRPLTTLLMRALQCYDYAMVDISPLTQIGAIAILAWIGVLVARRFDIRSPWAAALAAFPLGGQPFFLMNLSYKFDALSMALAVFFAALPVLSPSTGRRGWWLGILWMFFSLSLYQPAINVYLLYAWLELMAALLRRDTFAQLRAQCMRRGSQALAGMLIYQLLVGLTMVHGWVGSHAKIHKLDELLRLPHNIADYYRYIADGFGLQWWLYFLPVLLLLAALPSAIGLRYAWQHCKQRPVLLTVGLLLASLLLPVVGLLGVMGPLLLLVKPFLCERVMIGVGGWLSIGLVMAYLACRQWQRSPRWMLAMGWMLALGMEVLASAYGNAMGAQNRYEARIASRLADDYAALQASGHVKALLLGGSAGYAPVTQHIIEQMPLVGRMVKSHLTATDTFHTPQFLAYFMPYAPYVSYSDLTEGQRRVAAIEAILASAASKPVWSRTSAYDLYKIDGLAVAIFRKQPSLRRSETKDFVAAYSPDGVSLIAAPLNASD
jgi:hypothetical protein